MILVIVTSLRHFLGWTVSAFSSRQNLILENLALRQQLLALHAKRPRRRLTTLQKLFWVVLLRLWSEWERALVLVTPRTVVGWHRAGFRLYWTWVSRARRNRSANLDMSCGGKQDSLLASARGPAPSLRGRRLDSDNFVLSEQGSLSQSEPRVTLSPWAALVAWTNIWPGHRIVNQRADTPSGGKLLLST